MAGEVFCVDGEVDVVFEETETPSGYHSIAFSQPHPRTRSLFTLAPQMAQPVEPAMSDAALQDYMAIYFCIPTQVLDMLLSLYSCSCQTLALSRTWMMK